MIDISQNILVKLSENEFVSMEVLVKICRSLKGIVDDVLEILQKKE